MSGNDLVGSLAVVTGGGSGIGRATCRIFAREGCKVVVADINHGAAEETVKQMEGSGHFAVAVNVGNRQSVGSLFSEIKVRCNRVPNIVVNCAGIAMRNSLLDHTEEDFDNVINVNLKGTFFINQEGCSRMIEAKLTGGSIINISSITATKSHPEAPAYSATKGGVESFTRAVALEMAPHGIRVNVISPGYIDTPLVKPVFETKRKSLSLFPFGRLGKPEEIAEMCAFLASSKSSYMTGSVVHVNGGYGV